MNKKFALISVSNKEGIVDFAIKLKTLNYQIISTGGTKNVLQKAGIKVISVSEITGLTEMLGGRVKTLHPNIHGALLAKHNNDEHLKQLRNLNIELIDLICVNLYPFQQVITNQNVSFERVIENIDIGGSCMLRSAAKNHQFVTVICDQNDYKMVYEELAKRGVLTQVMRKKLAQKAFLHTANYDKAIANYLIDNDLLDSCEEQLELNLKLKKKLKYGENPHQKAAFYKSSINKEKSVFDFAQKNGKELSYNNIQDIEITNLIINEFDKPCVVVVKHKNPCGVALGDNIIQAWDKAYQADSVSIFGGVVYCNREVDEELAIKMNKIFLEIIISPSFSTKALNILTKKKKLILLEIPKNSYGNSASQQIVGIKGGFLVQDLDSKGIADLQIKSVTKIKPNTSIIEDLLFAWIVAKHVNSNAIVVASEQQTLGIGAGQMNRIGAAQIALTKSQNKKRTTDLVLASDGFFPFDDVVKLATEYQVKHIIQPGGSINDQQSIICCDNLGLSMSFTGIRHFKH